MFSVLEEVMKNTHRFNFFCFLLKVWSQFGLGDSWELTYISAGLRTKHFNAFFRDSWGNLHGMKITSRTPQAPCEFSHYCLLECQNTGSDPEFLDLIFFLFFGNYYWLFFIGNVWDWFKIGIIDSVEKMAINDRNTDL